MTSLLRVLRAVRSRTRLAIATVSAVGLVWVGITAAFFAQPASDPCAAGLAALDDAFSERDAGALHRSFVSSPDTLAVLGRVVDHKRAWRDTHLATCRAKPQPIATIGCLDARRVELAGYVDDMLLDGPAHAADLAAYIGDPALCANPGPGLLTARVPSDPALRREVTAVRHTLLTAQDASRTNDLVLARRLVDDALTASARLWPPLHAEVLYQRGTLEDQSGELDRTVVTFREAAALAESVHHDFVAAQAWTDLVQLTSYSEANPVRALEYATYAEAAIVRIGRPPAMVALLANARGIALVEADRVTEAEASLREAVRIAETDAPDVLHEALQGLAYVYELRGQYEEAVAMYRRSIALVSADAPPSRASIFSVRYAIDLAILGRFEEAEQVAREAVALADTLGEDSLDRYLVRLDLADILQRAGRNREALPIVEDAVRAIGRIRGERDQHYAEALELEGLSLFHAGRFASAERKLARACDILAFGTGDHSTAVALCASGHARALAKLGRVREARVLLDRSVYVLERTHGRDHRFTVDAAKLLAELD